MHGVKTFTGLHKNESQNRFNLNGQTIARQQIMPVTVKTPAHCAHVQETDALSSSRGRKPNAEKINKHCNNKCR
eukprot:2400408-Ditylum_brightwellii.AAC.1